MKRAPKRILHIVSAMDRGGAETLIMNIYRNLDRTKLQFDFVVHSNKINDFEEEIIKLGGKIFKIPSLGQLGPVNYIKDLMKIMKSNHYIAIHSHTDYQSGFPALAAKLSGIKKRICHSHSNNWPNGGQLSEKMSLKVLQKIIRFSATNYCSCSKEAAQFLFGNRLVDSGKVGIFKNGIDISEFTKIEADSRNSVIRELKLPNDAKILGHVGRFSDSKNQIFVLNLLKKLLEDDERYCALLIGDGPLKEQMEAEAERLGIIKHVKFMGVRTDIPRLMKAFDVFLFPSKFEGFGIVVLEAQSAGTPCVLSAAVPKMTDMGLGLTTFVDLKESLEVWCQKVKESINKERPNSGLIMETISEKGYNIQSNVNEWIDLYGAS
ncbi:glycosyltransferase EpsF [Neobacillus niacini]|nr:glycosyltransferase EpsF [Neobacillus niacini]